ncbi:BLUF domain-containing protein [Parasphingopyxis algicola]|nr:BLUF domain-containing protein [Parasphingopyxis algicola]
MALTRLVYASRLFGFDEATLNGILVEARAHNARNDISGALICRADLYLQLLEGPDNAVDGLYARIVHDDRHVEPKLLIRESAEGRLFGVWAMRDDPVQSWMWTQEEVANGAVESANKEEILAVFGRLSKEVGS